MATSLRKDLGLFGVYSIAMGTTLSAGFFLLPGLAYAQAGPAIVFAYGLAAVLLLPAMYSLVELSTAMPKAGGAYFFLDRSMGPLVGTLGGVGTWLVLVMKSAFALIGIGAYLGILLPRLPIVPVACGLAVVFGVINLFGAKKTGGFQVVLVLALLAILAWFITAASFAVDTSRFQNFFAAGSESVVATAGLVYISFAGLTKITSVAEEVRNPERNLALGMFLALGTAILVYVCGTAVVVGTVPGDELSGSLIPIALAAESVTGRVGVVVVVTAALLGFLAAANAGILSASRYPLAMGKDRLLPEAAARLSKRGVPANGVYVTVAFVLFVLIALDPMKIAKLASAFQLIMFALLCLAVIVMRESKIRSYDPGFRSPLYPWMQLAGIAGPIWILTKMGTLSIVFSAGLVVVGIVWYRTYVRHRVDRHGAIYNWFERLGRRSDLEVDRDLREILKVKGLRDGDPFDLTVSKALVIDATDSDDYDTIVRAAAALLSPRLRMSEADVAARFHEGEAGGLTPVRDHVALPHFHHPGIVEPEMVIVRSMAGLKMRFDDFETGIPTHQAINAAFFLVSPESNPALHLRILAHIASAVEHPRFFEEWMAAADDQDLKEYLLRHERYRVLRVDRGQPGAGLAGKTVAEIPWPADTIAAMIKRNGDEIFPAGSTVFEPGDRVIVLGTKVALNALLFEG